MRSDGTAVKQLFTSLVSSLGRETATRELKWMKSAALIASHSPTLPAMLQRRLSGEPLQYILGTTPFGPLDLLTRPPTLIPRPETEHWTLQLADLLTPTPARPLTVLDLCTGTGCIPLLLCHLWPPGSTRAYGVDISQDAIRLATDNAARCNIPLSHASSLAPYSQNVFIPVLGDLRNPDVFKRVLPPFDVITANPPYIPKREYDELPISVKNYEDPAALLGDPPGSEEQDGLTFYRLIAQLLAQKGMLREGSIVALEVGQGQADAVEAILQQSAGLRKTQVWKDPWNVKRVVLARA
ncbi:S-adenosyl-L-methionine-dependent methyltransferase [Suillus clintonianus]|uniref:S-adenosyl-L-methionine-dependent methyltransferase n=1 Tax=Suillus clintonianus TaxID=1904413 RepID=UPI001B867445|nr:S-adenosyl-L-methionine-dependent methyltransferase [Suillus clintonianus]KAG2150934.1 S-adenosyl-L-methionine-dependent methyltransferase [Suillus clintonianus]